MRLVILLVLLVGCSQGSSGGGSAGACNSSIVKGSWASVATSNTLTFNADCTGSDIYCASTFTYPPITATFGTATVTVTSTNGNASCLPLGDTNCDYQVSGVILDYDCGAGVISYTKQ